MYVFTCVNPDCPDRNVGRPFNWNQYLSDLASLSQQASAAGENFDTTPHVYCGTCNTEITASGVPQTA